MILTYRILTTLIYPLLLIFILFRKFLKKEDASRYKEKIFTSHFNVDRRKDFKLIWFHAASIGEVKSIIPIIEELNTSRKNIEFLVTTTTLSSSNLANEELKKFNNTRHRFFPLDVDFLINRANYIGSSPVEIFKTNLSNLIIQAFLLSEAATFTKIYQSIFTLPYLILLIAIFLFFD